jgi:hypothetical protein
MSKRTSNSISANPNPAQLVTALDGFLPKERIDNAEVEGLFKSLLDNDKFNKNLIDANQAAAAVLYGPVTVGGFTIPAGTTAVTVPSVVPATFLQSGSTPVLGAFGDVPGLFSQTGGTYAFTRSVAGSAAPIINGSRFFPGALDGGSATRIGTLETQTNGIANLAIPQTTYTNFPSGVRGVLTAAVSTFSKWRSKQNFTAGQVINRIEFPFNPWDGSALPTQARVVVYTDASYASAVIADMTISVSCVTGVDNTAVFNLVTPFTSTGEHGVAFLTNGHFGWFRTGTTYPTPNCDWGTDASVASPGSGWNPNTPAVTYSIYMNYAHATTSLVFSTPGKAQLDSYIAGAPPVERQLDLVSASQTNISPSFGAIGTNLFGTTPPVPNFLWWGKVCTPGAVTFNLVRLKPASTITGSIQAVVRSGITPFATLLGVSADIPARIWNAAVTNGTTVLAYFATPITVAAATKILVGHHAYGEHLSQYSMVGGTGIDPERYYYTTPGSTDWANVTLVAATNDSVYFNLEYDAAAALRYYATPSSATPVVTNSALEDIFGKADILLPDEVYALANTPLTGGGTVSLAASSTALVGVGTSWSASMEGAAITCGTYTGTMVTYISATSFTVSPANGGSAVSAGTTYTITELEQFSLWNEAVMGRGWAHHVRMHDWVSTYGTHWKEKFRLDSPSVAANGSTIQLRLLDFNLREVKTKTTTLKVSSRSGHGAATVLCIGDSRLYGGEMLAQAVNRLSTITTVGNRLGSGVLSEGRGGFTVAMWENGDNGIYTSHFAFPSGISAANYVGNSEWLRVAAAVQAGTNTNPTDVVATNNYSRLLNNGGGSLQYSTTTGYPITPTLNMVIYNPTLGAGLKFQFYNGSTWVTNGTQPSTWAWSFGSWLTRYSITTPTHVFITLGANDFAQNASAPDFQGWLNQLNAWVISIHAVSSSIKVFIGLPEQVSDTDGTGAIYGALYNAETMRYVYQRQQAAIIAFFGTSAMRALNTYIAPFALAVDPSDGWTDAASATKRSKYSSKTEILKTDGIHESLTVGKKQVGDVLAACVAAYS